MCRYDEDYEWLVEATKVDEMAEVERRCGDCGRTIRAGEPHVAYEVMVVEGAEHWPLSWWATARGPAVDDPYTFDDGRVHIFKRKPILYTVRIAEDDEQMWVALGFDVVDEYAEEDRPEVPDQHQCSHCHRANRWLIAVCDQSTVMVTREDLIEHTHDYGPEDLGPDFMALAELAVHQWHREEMLVPVETVEQLTERAVKHAIATGLHP